MNVDTAAVTSDVLHDAVHHHTTHRGYRAALRGKAAVTLCGIRKKYNPQAAVLPCCPMCASELDRLNGSCATEVRP